MYGTSRFSPRTRAFLVSEAARIGVSSASRNCGTSRRTVYRWRGRAGVYVDRSSRPHRSPRCTSEALEASVLGLRLELRWGPNRLGPYLDLQPSTVHRILRRHQANRLSHLFPKAPRSFGRFAVHEPGELIGVDIKSFGSLGRGGGKRGRDIGLGGQTNVGWQHLHVAIDLASRVVYAELRAGLGYADTLPFVANAIAFFDSKGIRVRRVLTDNGSGYKRTFDQHCARLGVRHTHTRPYHPWTNGRVERVIGTLQRECVYTTHFSSDAQRALDIALYLAYYNTERPHTRLGGLAPLRWLAQRRGVTEVWGELRLGQTRSADSVVQRPPLYQWRHKPPPLSRAQ
jgi:transposase InsO family protein